MDYKTLATFVSIGIFLFLILLGFLFSMGLKNSSLDKVSEYRKAVELNTNEEFVYALKTSVGHAFSYGRLVAVDPISVSCAQGKYMYCKTIEERYTRHERMITETYIDENGKSQAEEKMEEYYTWDIAWAEEDHASLLSFCGVEFSYDRFNLPSPMYYSTEYITSDVRRKHYILDQSMFGTIYTDIFDQDISQNSSFYHDRHPTDAKRLKIKRERNRSFVFWCAWISVSLMIAITAYSVWNPQIAS